MASGSAAEGGTDPLAGVAALPEVPEALAAARDALDRLTGARFLRRFAGEVAAETAVRAARASAALEGAELDLDDVRRLARAAAAGDPPGRAALGAEALVGGALRVAAELSALAPTWRRAPQQVLARLHVLAAADLLPEDALGRPRAGRAEEDPLGLGAAPPPPVVTARLGGLGRLVAGPTRAPALVVAAVVHGELLTLRPFAAGNGVVARAAARLVLVSRGADPTGLCALEGGHLRLGAGAYARAAAGYSSGGAEGVAGWVRHCAEAVRLGAQDGLAVGEALVRGQR